MVGRDRGRGRIKGHMDEGRKKGGKEGGRKGEREGGLGLWASWIRRGVIPESLCCTKLPLHVGVPNPINMALKLLEQSSEGCLPLGRIPPM